MTKPITRGLALLALSALLVALPGAATGQDDAGSTDLAAAFPDTVGGAELAVEVFEGQAWLDRQDASTPDGQQVAERTQALLAATGASIDDLTVAAAQHQPSEGNHAAITAVRVEGASAADLVRPTIGLLLGDVANPAIAVRQLGSRHVLRVSDADLPGSYPRTILPYGDTVWVIEAEQPLLLEIVEALPGEPADELVDPAPELVATVPFRLGGQARSQVQVSSGWGTILSTAPGEMFGPEYEAAELDLFLNHGVTSQDLWSTLGVWDTVADGAFLVGFTVEGADAEVMDQVLTDVIVPAFSATSQQPTVEQREVAGQTVTVVTDQGVEESERAGSTYHFLTTGDTVWMINLASGDDAVLAEALEALAG